jgi:hypothetical protein
MIRPNFSFLIWCVLLAVLATNSSGDFPTPGNDSNRTPQCVAQSDFHEAWIKVVERTCLKCHVIDGEASESSFKLHDLLRVPASERARTNQKNCDALTELALINEEDGRSRLLAKSKGELDHGGGEILKQDSTAFRVLQDFVRSRQKATTSNAVEPQFDDDSRSLFENTKMISEQQLLRRITLSLAARLPTVSERDSIDSQGISAFESILANLMREEAFYNRLQEGFNDIFLTRGYDGNGEDVLSYNHFEHTRHWYQKHDLDQLPEKERQKARYKLADQYREALRREPLELVRFIVDQDRPFTEIVNANYTMVSPYTARGYGVFDVLRDQFKNPDDPFEFIPTKLNALKHRDGKTQPTVDGFYPHAGILSMFQYLRRYPTTETNRNRLRARMVYQHFLGVDIMNLAPRVGDAAAIDAKYKIPTMQAAECVVCHRTIDPIAGLFQDYYNEEGHYGPRKAGWFADMFGPGCEKVDLPATDLLRPIQWLGQRIEQDPRFAVAMVEHVYYILMGRKVLLPPDDIDDPHFAGKRLGYLAQRQTIEHVADRFRKQNFNLKVVFQEWVLSPFYRVDGLNEVETNPERMGELDDLGVVRMLGPEQLERKIVALFGKPWGRLTDSYAILYGGIDSQEVTERLTEPSGAIGAIQRMMANDVACKNVAADFALPANQRRLFPGIELDIVPTADDPAVESKLRAAIVHLHRHVLGRDDSPNGVDVDQTLRLFKGIVAQGTSRGRFENVESYFCKSSGQDGPRDLDPHYTMRAWRAVVTYLLRQHDFLYE